MKTLYVRNRKEWRAWLRKNFRQCTEIWLVYYKKNSGKPRIPYDDAVEEALCFGWIDGQVRKIDDARFAQRFTPRQPKSAWSAINITRAKKMIAAKQMTPAGLSAFGPERRREYAPQPDKLPPALEETFRSQAEAWKNFQAFPPYYRRMTSMWVASAKKEETQRSRLDKLIAFSARNERIKFM